MKRWCLALVWMLVLALPLQGLAAASRLMCHHAQPASTAPQASPCHEDGAAAAEPATAHAGCIACAACHGMATLPSHLPALPPALPAPAPVADGATPVAPFLTTGPERPPRTDLA